jgi:RNA polymerase sigma-70 factor, ECF subfamily
MPTDQLIQACTTTQPEAAWEEFMRRYHPLITAAAVRVARKWGEGEPEEIDDVVQEIYLKFCADRGRILVSFRSEQPDGIFGYIKVVATNAARDFFRRKAATKRGAALTYTLTRMAEHVPIPSDLEQRLTLLELHRLLKVATNTDNGPRDRLIFQLYYREGLTARGISELPGINLNPKGVEGVLHRLVKAVRDAATNTQEMTAD